MAEWVGFIACLLIHVNIGDDRSPQLLSLLTARCYDCQNFQLRSFFVGKSSRNRVERQTSLVKYSNLSCLNWKWRQRPSVKVTERTHEEAEEALDAGREGCHSEAAFGGTSADLGSGTSAISVRPLAEGVVRERSGSSKGTGQP